MCRFFLFLSVCLFIIQSCSTKVVRPVYWNGIASNDELPKIEYKFERFRNQMMGHFSNKEQIETDPTMQEALQEFIIVPVFKKRANEFWVYNEFFSPEFMDQPLDQRIQQFRRIHRDTFLVEIYYLSNPDKFINAWMKEKAFDKLDIENDLIRDEHCDIYIVPTEDKRYHYSTTYPDKIECDLKGNTGATKYMNMIYNVSDFGYNMRFQFYDRNKKLLRETKEKGISFKRLNFKDKNYKDYTKLK